MGGDAMPTVAEGARRLGLSRMQAVMVTALLTLLVAGFYLDPDLTGLVLVLVGQSLFIILSLIHI